MMRRGLLEEENGRDGGFCVGCVVVILQLSRFHFSEVRLDDNKTFRGSCYCRASSSEPSS